MTTSTISPSAPATRTRGRATLLRRLSSLALAAASLASTLALVPASHALAAAPGAPVIQQGPAISGTLLPGSVLTATPGVWSGAPSNYWYQWMKCTDPNVLTTCSDVVGGGGNLGIGSWATVVLSGADVGQSFRIRIVAVNAAGASDTFTSWYTGAVSGGVPVALVNSTISGSTAAGGTLSATPGQWTNNPTAYWYQWVRCSGASCVDVVNGGGNLAITTPTTLTTTVADIGSSFKVRIVAVNGQGASGTLTSANTGTIVSAIPVVTANASITGSVVAGGTLSATPGQWTNNPTAYWYQWVRCNASSCTDVVGGSGNLAFTTPAKLTTTAADVGYFFKIRIVAVNASGSSATLTSANTGAITASVPVLRSNSVISGSTVVGGTLSATPGQWTNNPTAYWYQWVRCNASSCTDVIGGGGNLAIATPAKLTTTAADIGSYFKIRIVAVNTAGSSLTLTSPNTGTIGDIALVSPVAPVIRDAKWGSSPDTILRSTNIRIQPATATGAKFVSREWFECTGPTSCKSLGVRTLDAAVTAESQIPNAVKYVAGTTTRRYGQRIKVIDTLSYMGRTFTLESGISSPIVISTSVPKEWALAYADLFNEIALPWAPICAVQTLNGVTLPTDLLGLQGGTTDQQLRFIIGSLSTLNTLATGSSLVPGLGITLASKISNTDACDIYVDNLVMAYNLYRIAGSYPGAHLRIDSQDSYSAGGLFGSCTVAVYTDSPFGASSNKLNATFTIPMGVTTNSNDPFGCNTMDLDPSKL